VKSFYGEASGKWILAGEHAVLRGSPALVFPLTSRKFSLRFNPGGSGLKLKSFGDRGSEFEQLLWAVMDKACSIAHVSKTDLNGEIEISSAIPIGSGLGASAALCVTIARWFESFGAVKASALYEFSRDLEDLFHGESSGVDVAVAISNKAMRFRREGERVGWSPLWIPKLYISYSGERGVTLECVRKVKSLIQENPKLGEQVDQDMQEAVALCERALKMNPSEGLPMLIGALELAQSCFVRWGLVSEGCEKKIKELRAAGAQVVKMTGSGDGGYLLSLWEKEPPANLEFISCF
jgi:mevalonate kinase